MESYEIANTKYAIVIGGLGNLGYSLASLFLKKGWGVLVINHKREVELNFQSENIHIISINSLLSEDLKDLNKQIDAFKVNKKITGFNCIANCAGGFSMENIKSDNFVNAGIEMIEKNYISTLLTAHIASKHILEAGLILITGSAKAFKENSADLILYQTSKTACHSVALSLKDSNELPINTCIITILPEIFDTPQNRTAMPLEDFSKWTSVDSTADLIYMWASDINRPKSGSFCLLKNINGLIVPEYV